MTRRIERVAAEAGQIRVERDVTGIVDLVVAGVEGAFTTRIVGVDVHRALMFLRAWRMEGAVTPAQISKDDDSLCFNTTRDGSLEIVFRTSSERDGVDKTVTWRLANWLADELFFALEEVSSWPTSRR